MENICVYSSSSCIVAKEYFLAARELGMIMAQRGNNLIFGGGMVGLMGETAKAVQQGGGKVIGVIPRALNQKGIVYEACDQLIVTEDMRQRKAIMDQRSDAFIALPGGFGTLEELLEIVTLKQLKYHNKPIVILNINGFYDGLIEVFENIIDLNFAKGNCRDLYYVADDSKKALDYIEGYVPQEWGSKWLTDIGEK